jgi:hypothetical protein
MNEISDRDARQGKRGSRTMLIMWVSTLAAAIGLLGAFWALALVAPSDIGKPAGYERNEEQTSPTSPTGT